MSELDGISNNLTENDGIKKNKVEKEFLRLKNLFLNCGKEYEVIEPLIQNAAFIRITLEDLQDRINQDGVVETYMNGANQYGTKQSAALQSYNSLVAKYASVTKTLAQYVPYESRASLCDVHSMREADDDESPEYAHETFEEWQIRHGYK